jgi:hypothetical protein
MHALAYVTCLFFLVLVAPGHAEICVVRTPKAGSASSVGRGVYVGHGIVLTAWHVLRDAQGQPALEFRGRAYTGRRVARASEGWDLAAINIEEPSGLTPSKLYRGGWPSVEVQTQRSTGEPVQGLIDKGTGQVFAFRGAVLPGDAGGPIWCDEGVVSVVSSGDQRFTVGPPPPVVQAFLMRVSRAWCPDCMSSSPTNPVLACHEPTPAGPPESTQETRPMIDPDVIAKAILFELRTNPALRGLEGPVGPAGPAGPPGPAGPAGPAPDIDLDAIRRSIAENKEKIAQLTASVFCVEVIQLDGSVQTGQVTTHGGLLRLDFSQ